MTEAKQKAIEAVEAARDELVEISVDIHEHPELAMKETRAAGLLADKLEARGFAVERGAWGIETAFKARWGEGPVTVAYLCEYDALPEIGHACGHNLIATTGLGGAYGLKAAVSPSDVTLLVLGSPAEEDIGGKCMMIERGAFEGVDVALMAHPAPFDIAAPPMYGVESCEVDVQGAGGARLSGAGGRHQRARRPRHRLPGDRPAPPAHAPRRPNPRHHHLRRLGGERRAGPRGGQVPRARAAAASTWTT